MVHIVLDILDPDNDVEVLVTDDEEEPAGKSTPVSRAPRDRQVQKQVININGEIVAQ